MTEDSADAPLITSSSSEHDFDGDNGKPSERSPHSPAPFVWALTAAAGISGLLFGYE